MSSDNPANIEIETKALNWTKEKLTKNCLIAFDLDKTVLEQDSNEIQMFLWSISQTLIHLQSFPFTPKRPPYVKEFPCLFVNIFR